MGREASGQADGVRAHTHTHQNFRGLTGRKLKVEKVTNAVSRSKVHPDGDSERPPVAAIVSHGSHVLDAARGLCSLPDPDRENTGLVVPLKKRNIWRRPRHERVEPQTDV